MPALVITPSPRLSAPFPAAPGPGVKHARGRKIRLAGPCPWPGAPMPCSMAQLGMLSWEWMRLLAPMARSGRTFACHCVDCVLARATRSLCLAIHTPSGEANRSCSGLRVMEGWHVPFGADALRGARANHNRLYCDRNRFDDYRTANLQSHPPHLPSMLEGVRAVGEMIRLQALASLAAPRPYGKYTTMLRWHDRIDSEPRRRPMVFHVRGHIIEGAFSPCGRDGLHHVASSLTTITPFAFLISSRYPGSS
jgi:hypothetical protein